MATKNYMIKDKWLDLDKQNIVELQSVDGELDSLKVNGSEVVTPSGKITITENGTDIDVAQYATADVAVEGGSSDFSTAVVTMVIGDNVHGDIYLPNIENDVIYSTARLATGTISAVLYKGETSGVLEDATGLSITTSGDVVYNAEDLAFIITGDGTITIS